MVDALEISAKTNTDALIQLDSQIPTIHWKTQDQYSLQELPKLKANSMLQLWARTCVAVAAVASTYQ